MSKIAIIYWTGTGNTLEMARAIENSPDDDGIAACEALGREFAASL